GREPALPALPVQYADFAVWQRESLRGERLDGLLGYWLRQLDGMPALALPLDFPRPAVQAHRGAALSLELSGGLVAGMGRLSRECRATLFMVLLAGFAWVLGRFAGQDEVVIGAPVAVRDSCLGAYAHAELPFERLVEDLAPSRDLSRNPLFQVTFQLFDSPTAPDLVH